MIIGISGVRGSGKSLLAKSLEKYGYKRVSLAGYLKGFCRDAFGLTEEQVNGNQKETPSGFFRTDGNPLTPRDIMIRTGIFFRSIDPLFFCKKIDTRHNIVIDDIRFRNEIEYFKAFGAKFARIERDPGLNIYKAALDDLSETELNDYGKWDYKLEAYLNRVPADLEKFAEHIVADLSRPYVPCCPSDSDPGF